jgi:hypothetical protein
MPQQVLGRDQARNKAEASFVVLSDQPAFSVCFGSPNPQGDAFCGFCGQLNRFKYQNGDPKYLS